ncbi:MAG: DNA gyrase subunit A, partial [Verrucomicrobiales bacterium]|nr:DNA gyrase subunit A [Verrucomicrobiales bacterium]
LNNLFKHTSLETSFSVNMLAIDNRRPRLLNVKDAINCYIEHRREVVLRRTRYLLRKAESQAEKLEAFLLAIAHLDEFIEIIRSSSNREEAFNRLKAYHFPVETARGLGILIRGQPSIVGERYIFTDVQVNHILELRLYQLTGLEREKVKADYDRILAEIEDLMDILAKEHRVLTIIKEELQAIKNRFGTPRLTTIQAAEGEIRMEDLIANKSTVVTLTHRGYIKRTDAAEYRTQARGGKGLKGMETRDTGAEDEEADFVEHLFAASSHDYLMFFTNSGRVYCHRVYAIPEMSRTGKGRSIKNLLNLRPDERIAAVLRLESLADDEESVWREDRFVVFATTDGIVKKTALSAFRNIRKDGINAINLAEDNHLVSVVLTDGEREICLVTHEGQAVRCKETDVRPMGRTAAGVKGVNTAAEDNVVSLTVVDFERQLLVVSEKGLGKRTPFADYRLTKRGSKGVITMNITEKTGKVVSALAVADGDEIMIMTTSGQSVRIPVSGIRECGRNAQGVKLMGLREGELIQDVAIIIADDGEDAEEGDADLPESAAPQEGEEA